MGHGPLTMAPWAMAGPSPCPPTPRYSKSIGRNTSMAKLVGRCVASSYLQPSSLTQRPPRFLWCYHIQPAPASGIPLPDQAVSFQGLRVVGWVGGSCGLASSYGGRCRCSSGTLDCYVICLLCICYMAKSILYWGPNRGPQNVFND